MGYFTQKNMNEHPTSNPIAQNQKKMFKNSTVSGPQLVEIIMLLFGLNSPF